MKERITQHMPVEHHFSLVDQPMSKFGMHFYGMGGPLYQERMSHRRRREGESNRVEHQFSRFARSVLLVIHRQSTAVLSMCITDHPYSVALASTRLTRRTKGCIKPPVYISPFVANREHYGVRSCGQID